MVSDAHTPTPPRVLNANMLEAFGELPSTLAADAAADQRQLQEAEDSQLVSRRVPVARKLLLTGLCLGALVALPYAHPALIPLRVLWPAAQPDEAAAAALAQPLPAAAVGEVQVPGRTIDQQARADELDAPIRDSRGPIAQVVDPGLAAKIPDAVDERKPPRPIDDPSGKALESFFAKLLRVERQEPGAVARILYFGDSIVASDFVTGALRRRLQRRFGDAGHGYALLANAWPGWFHIDVARAASGEWRASTCVGPYAEDGLYGLGCASLTARYPGIWSRIGTATRARWGQQVSRFEIEYLQQPGGGALDLYVDDQLHERLETEGPATQVAWHTIQLPDGPHSLEMRTVDRRPVRAFGVRMERDVPGVTVSAMGITGARARFLDKQDDDHWAEVLQAAKPDLVVLAFGSNEIIDGSQYPEHKYEKTLLAVMRQVRAAVPSASTMLVGPPDMATKKAGLGYSRPMACVMSDREKAIAAREGWAFWDQFQAMGGGGSMWAWIQSGLGSKDMFHPTGRGGNILGNWEYLALMQSYEKYKAAHR